MRFVFRVFDRDHLETNDDYNKIFSFNDKLICIRFDRSEGVGGVGLWSITGNSGEATSFSLSRSMRELNAARISIGELIRWTRDRLTVSTCQWHSSSVVAHPRRCSSRRPLRRCPRLARSTASEPRFSCACFCKQITYREFIIAAWVNASKYVLDWYRSLI